MVRKDLPGRTKFKAELLHHILGQMTEKGILLAVSGHFLARKNERISQLLLDESKSLTPTGGESEEE